VYISEIYASGFRCFDPVAPLQLKLSPGLNILVGPNDAGMATLFPTGGLRSVSLRAPDEKPNIQPKAGLGRVLPVVHCATSAGLFIQWEPRRT
jgi:hypothetical protein